MRKKEILQLMKEKEQLEFIIHVTENRLKHTIPGSLQICKHGKGFQLFYRTDPGERRGIYLHTDEVDKYFPLFQKKYDQQVLKAATYQLSTINNFLKTYKPSLIKELFQRQHQIRQAHITPVITPDDVFVREWLDQEYERKGFKEDDPFHTTDRGLRVRSKSEVMIAETLDLKGIPYRYEYPVRVNRNVYHPDFMLLRIEDRKEFYWEHLGRMDDPDYVNSNLIKIRNYEKIGIVAGDNLILTMETSMIPLNKEEIRTTLQTFLE